MRSSVLGVVLLISLAIPAAAQTTTYTYTGDPYTAATAPYVVGGQLTGTFTTASPLPAFLPLTDIRPSLQSLSFNDGVATRTLANSFICTFNVATDGAGNITRGRSFSASRRTRRSVRSTRSTRVVKPGLIQGIDLAGTGPAGADPCDPIVLTTSGGTGSQGSWSDNNPLGTQTTTYTYTGNPYTTANAPYTVGGNLTGTITTANPLPPFMPLTDIRPAIASLSFNDDVQARTLANSIVCSFQVATDGAGNITQWQITLREFPYTTGNPQQSIDSTGVPGILNGNDLVGTGLAGPGPCDPIALTTSASTSAEGSWTDNNPLGTQPTTYTYTGDPYTTATAPYVLGERLTGTMTTANPLPPFMPFTDISAALTSISFDDSVAVRTLANSFLCSVQVATDGAGNITRWQITLRESPYTTGNPQHSIDSSGTPTPPEGIDLVGTGPANADPCGIVILNPSASTASQGTWTDTNPLATAADRVHLHRRSVHDRVRAVRGWRTRDRHDHHRESAARVPAAQRHHDRAHVADVHGRHPDAHARKLVPLHVPRCHGRRGNITQWEITLRQSPYTTGSPQQSIDSSGNPGIPEGIDLAGTGLAGVSPCSPMVLTSFGSTQLARHMDRTGDRRQRRFRRWIDSGCWR